MTFIHAIVLSALTAALIPLLIHLLNRLKFREVEFSSLKFLKRLERKRLRKVKIAEWLLLALRMLAIVCIVLAFARPALQRLPLAGIGEAHTAAALIFDNSIASQAKGPQGDAISEIRRRALSALNLFQAEDRIRFLTSAHPVTSPLDDALPGNDRRLKRAILELEAVDSPVDWAGALASVTPWLEKAPQANKEIYLFSTFYGQQTGLDSAVKTIGDRAKIYLVEIGKGELDNIAITSMDVETRIFLRGNPVTVAASVTNFSANSLRGIDLSLFLNDKRVAVTQIDIPPNSVSSAKLKFIPETYGFCQGEIKLEAEDALIPDNRRYFVLYIPDKLDLYVYGEPAETQKLKIALKPSDKSDFAVEPKILNSLRDLPQNLNSTAIFLAGLKDLSASEASSLRDAVMRGASVAISPSANLDINNINRLLLQPLGVPQFAELLFYANGQSWSYVDYQHPIFEGVFADKAQIDPPLVWHYFRLASGSGDDIIKFKDGSPFLKETIVGEGKLLLFTSGFGDWWSNIAEKGIYAPLLHRTAVYLGFTHHLKVRTLNAGETLTYIGESAIPGFKLLQPNGTAVELIGKTVKNGLEVNYGYTGIAGIYSLKQDHSVKAMFAVNPALQHSALKRGISFDAVSKLRISAEADLSKTVQIARLGVELWRWFLVLGILMLLTETIISKILK